MSIKGKRERYNFPTVVDSTFIKDIDKENYKEFTLCTEGNSTVIVFNGLKLYSMFFDNTEMFKKFRRPLFIDLFNFRFYVSQTPISF